QGQVPGGDQARKYLEKMGIDPLKDIDTFTIVHPGTKNDLDDLLVVVEGSFNSEKFEATAEEAARENGEALRINKVNSVKVYEVTPPDQKRFFVSLLGGKAVVATSNQEIMNKAVARSVGVDQGKLKKQVSELLKTTTNAQQSMSLVITGTALARLAEKA